MSNNEVVFDKYEVDTFLNKQNDKFFKINDKSFISFLPNASKYKNQAKYFVDIQNENERYIGVFSSKFKRELFAYILFNQKDEYLGQISNEKKHGFGIYRFNSFSNNERDIYIGNFSENKMEGKGLYIKILKDDKKENEIIPQEYICYIGQFENGELKKGKIYNVSDNYEKLEFKDDEIKEELNKNGKESIYIEKKDDINLYSRGLLKDNRLIEGYTISIKNDGNIENKFFFKLKDDLSYEFKYLEDEEKEKELFEGFKNSNFEKFRKAIQDTLNVIDKMISDMKGDFEYAKNLNMGDDFKNYFSECLNVLMN